MAPLIVGLGYDWAIEQTAKCIEELVELVRPDAANAGTLPLDGAQSFAPPPLTITCKSADMLDHIEDASVDVVVMDPPYYDNVMYAELSDFFYVWLKRTAGHVVPELFTRTLTDKENEAVANPAKFAGQKGAKALAGRDYQERMARIFEECRRVLKPDGIMTLMFTHKATGAWDALTNGLMQAGFTITASWPINTEAEGSLHIKDKSAANSTIFLVCRPRPVPARDAAANYWEDIEPLVAGAVRTRIKEFQEAGISGVDLYLASFGPALEEFSRHWPLKRGTPRPKPEAKKRRRQAEMFAEEWDPYAVTPEDALEAARREVKRWRLDQLTHLKANEELDPLTSFFVLAWDAFRAPVFPYDEALRLARAVGVDLDTQVVGVLGREEIQRSGAVGQRPPRRQGRARADGWLPRHDRRRPPRRASRPHPHPSGGAGDAGEIRMSTRSPPSSPLWKRCWRCCRSANPSPASRWRAISPRPGATSKPWKTCAGWPSPNRWTSRSSLNCGRRTKPHDHPAGSVLAAEIHPGSRRPRRRVLCAAAGLRDPL